jgi:hypothetical protein
MALCHSLLPESEAAMSETKDVKALLTDAIRKRDELNTFIKLLQEMSGVAGTVADPAAGATTTQQSESGKEITDPLTVVYPGMFFGKTQPQAAKMLLERVRPRPLKTKTIVQCLKQGGLEVGGKKPEVNMWGILNRVSDTFILVPKAGWGLVEWYDPSVIAKYRQEDAQKENGGDEEKPKD